MIIVGGDGNYYYMTGSTGDNIWAFNDGVELWRSSDLKDWNTLAWYVTTINRPEEKSLELLECSSKRTEK